MDSSRWQSWKDYSFRKQLFIILTFLTALLTITFTFLLISYERHSHTEKLRREGEILASFLAKELQLPVYAGFNEDAARRASALFRYPTVRAIKVINAKGELAVDVHAGAPGKESKTITVVSEIASSNSGYAPEELLLGELPRPGSRIGSIQLQLNTYSLTARMEHFIKVAIWSGLLFWLIISAIGYLILKQMTGTLGVMLNGIESIAAGNLENRIEAAHSSDARRAAAAINILAEKLMQREEENRRLQQEKVNSLRLEFDEEKKQYMAKLIQTNRMTSLGLLVSSMAHEINNPNGAIRLSGEYLENAWRDMEKLLAQLANDEGDFTVAGIPFSRAKEEITSTIGNIARSSGRIERVVQNLRSYSLGNRGETMHNVDINRVASGALAIVQANSLKTDINIVTRFSQDLPRMSGNPFQLEQVFTNLLMNAIQALPPKGTRRVELTTGYSSQDGELTVEVRDEGHGIEPEYIPQLCEPFFSTRINQGGSGLGLYISNFIVSEHGGRIEFDSKTGAGCTVTVYLPAEKQTTPLHPQASYSA